MPLLLVTVATHGAFGQGPPPTAVRVDAIRQEQVQEKRLVTGELRAVRRARVATEEAGLVLQVNVTEGQVVREGAALAKLDSKRLEIELQQVEADEQVAAAGVDERRADVQWRELDLENYRNLTQGGASNRKELYDAESQARISRAKLLAAERLTMSLHAKADLLRKRISDTTILAPFDGVIIAKNTEQGQWMDAGDFAVEMIATGSIDAWLDVPQQLAVAVVGKQPMVSVVVEATNATIDTSEIRIIPQVDLKARSFPLIARLENAKGALVPGMSVTAWVPTGDSAQRLTIHKDAVLRSAVGSFVYVMRSTGPDAPAIATPADVQVLFSIKDRFVVKSTGLAAGDLLIVEGNERLFPMAPVMPVNVEEAEARSQK